MSTFGVTTPGGSSGSIGSGYIRLGKFTLPENGDLSKITAYLANPNASAQVIRGIVYAADGADGAPSTYKGMTAEVSVADGTAAGWKDLAFASLLSLVAGDYYLGVFAGNESSQVRLYYATVTGNRYHWRTSDVYPTPPSPWTGGSVLTNVLFSINATYISGANPHYYMLHQQGGFE